MKPPIRQLVRPAGVVLAAVVIELVLERVLAQGDPIGSLLLGKVTGPVVIMPVLLVLRILLIVLAPGWLVTKAVGTAFVSRVRGTSGSGTEK